MAMEKQGRTFKTAYLLVFIFVVLGFFMVGCSKKDEKQPADGKKKSDANDSQVVAKIGNTPISAGDFKAYLSSRPMPFNYYSNADALKSKLDELVAEEVMYQEALRAKVDQDPQVMTKIRQIVSQKMIEDQVNRKVWTRAIEENELQEYYKQNESEFNRPEQVRVADIFVALPADATEEKKAELKKKAEEALAEASALNNKRSGFWQLVKKYSDPHEKYQNGDTGYFDVEGKPVGVDPKMAEVAFKLEENGRVSEKLIESADGYHVIMLTGKRPAVNKPLEDVKRQIEQRIRREELQKKRAEYIDGLKAQAKITIDDKVLSDVQKEMQSTRGPQNPSFPQGGGMGMPGMPPMYRQGGPGGGPMMPQGDQMPMRPPQHQNMPTPPGFPGQHGPIQHNMGQQGPAQPGPAQSESAPSTPAQPSPDQPSPDQPR